MIAAPVTASTHDWDVRGWAVGGEPWGLPPPTSGLGTTLVCSAIATTLSARSRLWRVSSCAPPLACAMLGHAVDRVRTCVVHMCIHPTSAKPTRRAPPLRAAFLSLTRSGARRAGRPSTDWTGLRGACRAWGKLRHTCHPRWWKLGESRLASVWPPVTAHTLPSGGWLRAYQRAGTSSAQQDVHAPTPIQRRCLSWHDDGACPPSRECWTAWTA